MSASLVDGATTIFLPDDLLWTDEFGWLPTAQQADIAFDGALILQESAQQAGRPMTIEGDRNSAWIDRATLLLLQTLASTPRTTSMVLTLFDGRTFNVFFRHNASAPAVDAKPIVRYADPVDDDSYSLILRFLQA